MTPKPMAMSDTSSKRSRRNDQVTSLLQRLIDEVSQLRAEQAASRKEAADFRQHLFGSEGNVGIVHELRSFKAEQMEHNKAVQEQLKEFVKKDSANWIWTTLKIIGTATVGALSAVAAIKGLK